MKTYIGITPEREKRFFNKNGQLRETREVKRWLKKNAIESGETEVGETTWIGRIGIAGPYNRGVAEIRLSTRQKPTMSFKSEYDPDDIFAAELWSR